MMQPEALPEDHAQPDFKMMRAALHVSQAATPTAIAGLRAARRHVQGQAAAILLGYPEPNTANRLWLRGSFHRAAISRPAAKR